MTKENIKKWIKHYRDMGREDKVEELKKSYKKTHGEDYAEENINT